MDQKLDTYELIKRHFHRLKDNTMVLTKQLLVYGTRVNVDNATCSLVKKGIIKRLAWGLFIRADMKDPTLEEIIRAKAKAFGRHIKESAEQFAAKVARSKRTEPSDDGTREIVFATDGHSTSFRVDKIKIILRYESPRQFAIKDNDVGSTLRSLWQTGKKFCSDEMVDNAVNRLDVSESYQLKLMRPLMPNWLAEYFAFAKSNLKRNIFDIMNWTEQSDYVARGIPHPDAYYLKK